MTDYCHRFRTPEDAARFFDAYDAVLALWSVPPETLDVATTFGTTHFNVVGAPESPPLLLLHGAQMSSPTWYATVEPLSRYYRVYASDAVDQMGRSIPVRKLKTRQDCVDWLTGLLDALRINRAVVIGHSQGGFQALSLALAARERVERLVLLSPSGSLGRLRWQFLFKMLPVFVRPTRAAFYRAFQSLTTMPLGTHHPLAEQFMIGAQAFKPQELSLGVVAMLKDDELRRLSVPTLLLYGDQDSTCRPLPELERARRLIPHLSAELICGGGHLFPVDQPVATNAALLKFLTA